MDIVTIISIVLNVILIAIFFFQGTINDYFSHKRIKRESDREKEREDLKKLRHALTEFNQCFPLMASLCLIYQTRQTMSELKEIEPDYNKIKDKYDLAHTQLNNLRPDINQGQRDRLDKILAEAGKIIIYAVKAQKFVTGMENTKLTRDQYIQNIVNVGEMCAIFIADIENNINK